ncbi:MAG: efflux RND transporter periplasmic adaptor subunit [Lachnospiraceae bacterium]|nr:efflux RND transporter periplasmic adaptor subunit [Lachnospiraceae bacterium]
MGNGLRPGDYTTDLVDISSEIADATSKKSVSSLQEEEKEDVSVRTFRQKKKRKWIKWVVILVILAGIIAFVVYKVRQTTEAVKQALAGNVQTAEITRMDISSTISTTGTIQSKDVRTLTSPLAGVKIDHVNYKVGDMVEEGAVVVAFSSEDINKRIGQLEEDITEAKQSKALDGGNRTNTYVNSNDLETYSIATSFTSLQRALEDLNKARDELRKICDEKGDFKRLYEEAKENLADAEEELAKHPDDTDLMEKVSKYQTAISTYDTKMSSFESQEEAAQKTIDARQRDYDDAFVRYTKAGYDASFNQAKYDYNLNRGNLTANDEVKNLERQKEEREDSLENYIVTAPISGLVTTVNAEEGNGWQATSGALMVIQAVDVLEVTTQVDEYDINNVVYGQKVAIMTDATGDDELEGRVTFVAPTATIGQQGSSSNTFEVKIDILNKDDRLKLGMSAKLNILVDSHEQVLAVPYDAIEEKDGGAFYVYALDSAPAAGTDESKSGELTDLITVVGMDGKKKETQEGSAPAGPDGKPAGREIPVQLGLEGDYYTEVISPDIEEGMQVLVNGTAGELPNDLEMLMGM